MVDRIGQQFGNYRLVRLLGKGGFAEVYLGEHLYIKRQAAVKLLRTTLEQRELEKFLVEAQRLVDVAHPHIVRVLDFAVEDGVPYLVMEYAPNGTLRTCYPRGSRLALDAIIPYITQAAAALQYIHDQRLVHRDIKPENMLLGSQQELLLSDFGVAAIAHATQSLDLQGHSGTPPYMAPEQIQGKPRPASDQYALGIVVYEWLSGSPPFGGSISEVIGQHMFATPPLLRETLPSLAPQIEAVIFKALAKDPKERFENVQLFAQHLEQAYREADSPSLAATRLLVPALAPEPALSRVSLQDSAFSAATPPPESTLTMETTRNQAGVDAVVVPAEVVPAQHITASHEDHALATSRLEDDDPDASLPPAALDAASPTVSGRATKLLEAQTPSSIRTKTLPRRTLVAGLAALIVGGGAIAYIIQQAEQTGRQSNIAGSGAAPQTPQSSTPQSGTTTQTKTTAAHTSSSGSQPGTTPGTQVPTRSTSPVQPGSQAGSQPGSQPPPQSAPAAGSTPTQPTQPTPQPVQLTLQITNCPQNVNNNTNVPVTVTANQPGVSTQLIVTYDLVSDIFKSQLQPTGSDDSVVLTWHVGLVKSLLGSLLNAHVTAVATDQNGKQVQSPSVQVQVHLL
ncbi:MAG: serine/threonine protein kinase [Chloroflexota bacterium]|nr:serine/threonine protein kinase [Chloroflexota bacterium]